AHLEDYQELSKVGSVTFGGSKGSISGKGSKEVIDIDVQTEEAEELLVVSSTSSKAASSEHNATKKSQTEQGQHLHISGQGYARSSVGQDSMNYIPVSLQNQANPAGSKEVIDIDVQTEEAEELLVVSSTSRKAADSEHNVTKKRHSLKKPSSTPISKSADDIMIFRKELDALL
ncbi:hypothetical protein Tco_1013910, partial [Tanacetum coccineum]